MRKYIFFTLLILLSVALFSCEDKNSADKLSSGEQSQIKNENVDKSLIRTPENLSGINKETNAEKDITDVKDRMIVKTGSMGIEVEKFDEAAGTISITVSKFNGFILSSNASQTASGLKQGSISVKIPAGQYDAFINEISGIGKVLNKNIQSSDITEEYIDLESRLKTQKELEERLLALLRSQGNKLSDVLEIEEKLASVRQKIESTEGRMKYLKNQASMSILTINLYEPSLLDTSSGGGFFYELGQAVKKGLNGFVEILKIIIIVLIALIPILIILLILYIIIKLIFKKKKNKIKN